MALQHFITMLFCSMKTNMKLSQQQRLVLSPQMREYLRLLHLPVAELRQAVDKAIEENPMLEEAASPETAEAPVPPMESTREDEGNLSRAVTGDWDDAESINFFKSPTDFSKRPAADMQHLKDFQDSLLTRPESLFNFLEWQIQFLAFTGNDKTIAGQIMGNINEDGYLTATIGEIARAAEALPEDVERVLAEIQKLDPPGVGARDLKEALLIQLSRRGPGAGLAREIVLHHLDLVAKKDWRSLARIFRQSEAAIRSAVEMISRLEPRPGRSFYAEEAITVTPDATISIRDGSDNDLEIRVNDEFIPRLRINAEYRKMLRDRGTDRSTRDFLKTRLSNGMDFIKALELRKSTIRSITEEIVKAQPLFFTRGFSHLRPLRMKDIAERLDLHESTVSRAIHGKYMSTPQGTIPFKSFFSPKIGTEDGTGESQKSIMEKVKALIDREDPRKPLSDQAIAESLAGDGIRIARRTVAKYREALNILPTHLRKKR